MSPENQFQSQQYNLVYEIVEKKPPKNKLTAVTSLMAHN